MNKIAAEVFADPQHGPGVTVCIDGVQVSVYLLGETGIVTRDDGRQYGLEVAGPWAAFREQVEHLYQEDSSNGFRPNSSSNIRGESRIKQLENERDALASRLDALQSERNDAFALIYELMRDEYFIYGRDSWFERARELCGDICTPGIRG